MDKATLTGLLGAVVDEDPEIAAAVLYGSRARGDARPDSDWDVALLMHPNDYQDHWLSKQMEYEHRCGAHIVCLPGGRARTPRRPARDHRVGHRPPRRNARRRLDPSRRREAAPHGVVEHSTQHPHRAQRRRRKGRARARRAHLDTALRRIGRACDAPQRTDHRHCAGIAEQTRRSAAPDRLGARRRHQGRTPPRERCHSAAGARNQAPPGEPEPCLLQARRSVPRNLVPCPTARTTRAQSARRSTGRTRQLHRTQASPSSRQGPPEHPRLARALRHPGARNARNNLQRPPAPARAPLEQGLRAARPRPSRPHDKPLPGSPVHERAPPRARDPRRRAYRERTRRSHRQRIARRRAACPLHLRGALRPHQHRKSPGRLPPALQLPPRAGHSGVARAEPPGRTGERASRRGQHPKPARAPVDRVGRSERSATENPKRRRPARTRQRTDTETLDTLQRKTIPRQQRGRAPSSTTPDTWSYAATPTGSPSRNKAPRCGP